MYTNAFSAGDERVYRWRRTQLKRACVITCVWLVLEDGQVLKYHIDYCTSEHTHARSPKGNRDHSLMTQYHLQWLPLQRGWQMMRLWHLSHKWPFDNPQESTGLQIFTKAPDAKIHIHQGGRNVLTGRTLYDSNVFNYHLPCWLFRLCSSILLYTLLLCQRNCSVHIHVYPLYCMLVFFP